MTPDPPPLRPLPVAASAGAPPRHETVLPDEPGGAVAELDAALGDGGAEALRAVVARHPAMLDAWARLAQSAWSAGDPVAAYAFARTGYHRGLDRLRRHGWGGTGMVRWSHPSNRGFLRALHMLMVAAAALDEVEESSRCRAFLLDLDPDDGAGAAHAPEAPGREWRPERLV